MNSIIPQFGSIGSYKFYNLDKYDWQIDCTEESNESNNYILQEIADDFSSDTGIDYDIIMKSFGKYVCGRSSENLLLLYSNKDSDNVYYYLTNYISETYKFLNKE